MDLSESMFLILCRSMDCSLLGSSVYGILQARVLEWVAISFSMGSSQPKDWTQVSCIAGRRFTFWAPAGVQPQLIQGIQSGDGVGEDQDTIASIRY